MRKFGSFFALLLLLGIAVALQMWNRPEPGVPEHVDEVFTICGVGSSFACVHDGDSFRLGGRKIRIRSIDAPEVGEGAKCEEERRKAVVARNALLDLVNAGPFTMTAKPGDVRDQYGRELRYLNRTGRDGKETELGADLAKRGLVHHYRGRKTSWCS